MVNKRLPARAAPPRAAEPRQRDADRSQRDILDAARDEFALHGLGANNRQLLAILPTLLAPPFVREAFHNHTQPDLVRAFGHHREILMALEAGDADWAEGMMRAHLWAGRRSLQRMELESPGAELGGELTA